MLYQAIMLARSSGDVVAVIRRCPGGDSHMEGTGMLIGNFEFSP